MMNEDILLEEIKRLSKDATGNNSTFIEQNAYLLDRYEGNPYGDEVPERSSVISNDVMDVVEADMTSLARVFLGPKQVMKFKPNSRKEDDIEEAEQKTKYVDWQVRHQPWSYEVLSGFLKNTLMQKVSVVKYFIEETEQVEEHKKTGLSDEDLALFKESLKGEDVESVEIDREEEDDNESTVVLKVKKKRKLVKIEGVELENFRMSKNAKSKDDAKLVGDVCRMTRGELLSLGFKRDEVSKIPLCDKHVTATRLPDIRDAAEGGKEDQSIFYQWASEEVLIEDLYIKVDYDQDGIAERRRVFKGGDVILINEVFNHVPYAIQSAILMPHKAIGKSRAELVAPTAKAKTYILRGIQDNIYAVNSPRMAANELVNQDDLLVIRPNGMIRTEGDTPPQNNMMPVVVPYIGDKALQVIQYWDQSRAQTTGSLLASQGLNADELGKETATRFEGVEDASKAKVEHVARNIAETGFRQLYEGVAWLDANYQNAEQEIEILGEELKVKPSDWKYCHYTKSRVGLGAGDDEEQMKNMMGLWQIHTQLQAMNSPMTDEVKRFAILKSLSESAGIADPTEYFNNPEQPEELITAQNEIMKRIIQKLQLDVQSLQNPLAEAEKIKAQSQLIQAQSKRELDIGKMLEDQRQFNADLAMKQDQFNKELAAKLAELEFKYKQDIPGFDLAFDPFTGLVEQLNAAN